MTDTTQHTDEAPDLEAEVAGLLHQIMAIARIQILHAVAALRIPDHLAGTPRTAAEVAELEGTHVRATYRLMRAAASLGVLRYESEGRFGLTGRGNQLRTGVPGSLRALLLTQAGPGHWASWGRLPEAVREGKSQMRNAVGADLFDYLALPENAEEAAVFAESMNDISSMVTRGAIDGLDITGVISVVDVGGADGQFVFELMETDADLRGQVLDLPHAADRAREEAQRRGVADRFTAVAGDFFVEVPAADLYLLKTVLHDWDDEQCTTILRNCRASAHMGARALVVEAVIGEIGKPDFATLSDITMLAVTNGEERTLEEYDEIFAASGWRRDKEYPVGGGYTGIEISAV